MVCRGVVFPSREFQLQILLKSLSIIHIEVIIHEIVKHKQLFVLPYCFSLVPVDIEKKKCDLVSQLLKSDISNFKTV